MLDALKKHWPEYLIEAGCLGAFMISACSFAALLGHPQSPVQMWFTAGMPMRFVMGLAMGLTAVALIYSPWGKRSGAHMNRAVTFTFWRLGKVASWDAFFTFLHNSSGESPESCLLAWSCAVGFSSLGEIRDHVAGRIRPVCGIFG